MCFEGKIRVDCDAQIFEMWKNTYVLTRDSDIQDYVTLSLSEEHSYSFVEVKLEAGAI